MGEHDAVFKKLAEIYEKERAETGSCSKQETGTLLNGEPAKHCAADYVQCPYQGRKVSFQGEGRHGEPAIGLNHLCGYASTCKDSQPQ